MTEITDKKATTPPATEPNEETSSDINDVKAETVSPSPVKNEARKSVIEGACLNFLFLLHKV